MKLNFSANFDKKLIDSNFSISNFQKIKFFFHKQNFNSKKMHEFL